MKPPNHEEEGNEGDALVNTKQSRKSDSGSGKKIIGGEGKEGKSRQSNHGTHIWTERERRKKMSNLFSSLHALLPQVPSKAGKSTVVNEVVNYIKSLEHTVEKLEKQKQERLQSVSTFGCESSVMKNSPWFSYDSREAFVADRGSSNNLTCGMVTSYPSHSSNSTSASTPRQPVAFQTWCYQNVVLNICGKAAQFCGYATRPSLLTAIAFVLEEHKIEVISANILCNDSGNTYLFQAHTNKASSHQFPEDPTVEEIYKQAAREIMLLIS